MAGIARQVERLLVASKAAKSTFVEASKSQIITSLPNIVVLRCVLHHSTLRCCLLRAKHVLNPE